MRWHDEWLLLPQRIALHEPTATAVVADLHLGYATARQRQGDAVPARDVADELGPLVVAAADHRIHGVVVAGDLFEAGYDAAILDRFNACLAQLGVKVIAIVPGNHDRGIDQAVGLPVFSLGYQLSRWRIVHGDEPTDAERVVMGHWHPAMRMKGRKRACFLAKASRLILPAFSLDAAGVDVAKDRRWNGWSRFVVDDRRVVSASD